MYTEVVLVQNEVGCVKHNGIITPDSKLLQVYLVLSTNTAVILLYVKYTYTISTRRANSNDERTVV